MKIATKALMTMVVVTMLTLSVVPVNSVSALQPGGHTKQLERLQQHHDRKLELRASLLGMTPEQLREALKTQSFNQIIRAHGFKTKQAYYSALLGKLKDELRARGWSDAKIQGLIDKRLNRLNHH